MTRHSDRAAMLAKVHMAKKDLALTEDSYRDLLERLTGHRSAGQLTDGQLHQVLAEFGRLGWAPKKPKGAAPKQSLPPHVRKVWALWLDLVDMGVVKRDGLPAFVKRMSKVDNPKWLTPEQAQTVTEALKSWRGRIEAGAER